MTYAICFGTCFGCGRTFGFNPVYVPSINQNGQREPICADCVAVANPARVANGLQPIVVHPEAYEPVEESELR